MSNVIKSFKFESENIILELIMKKEIFRGALKMFIDANVKSNNPDINITTSTNISSVNISFKYLNYSFFWISTNDWKGLRWDNYKNETKFSVYRDLNEMKEKYIEQREFITIVSEYFYDCIKNYRKLKLLYETSLNEIINENDPNTIT